MSFKQRLFVNLFFCIFIFFAVQAIDSSNNERLRINIISNRNGVGLSRDVDILTTELSNLGHEVYFSEDLQFTPYQKVDINLFVQPRRETCFLFFPYADKNYLIPNHEWTYFSHEELGKFDMILCKTKEAMRIFKPLNPHTQFIGFTCADCYQKDIPKNYRTAFHLAGASIQKGTSQVIKTWLANPQFPPLFLIKHKLPSYYPPASNLFIIFEYLSFQSLRNYQNNCGLHICPSETEGFGHYIVEGLSCGAVVVTTDAPPMNEFIFDKRCLVEYGRTEPLNLATRYYVDSYKLEEKIANLLSLSFVELEEIGKNNRAQYLKMDRLFKKRLKKVFGP